MKVTIKQALADAKEYGVRVRWKDKTLVEFIGPAYIAIAYLYEGKKTWKAVANVDGTCHKHVGSKAEAMDWAVSTAIDGR